MKIILVGVIFVYILVMGAAIFVYILVMGAAIFVDIWNILDHCRRPSLFLV